MSRVKYSRDLRKITKYLRKQGIALSIRSTKERGHPLFFGMYDATSYPDSRRIEILYRKSKFSSSHTLITLAHEYGHIRLGNDSLINLNKYDIARVMLGMYESLSEPARKVLWEEEYKAWQFARGFLISQGFREWDKFEQLRVFGLSTYMITFWGNEKKLKASTKKLIYEKCPI